MDFKVEQPPLKKKKKTKRKTKSSSPSLSLLPDEIILNCLARVSKSYYSSLSLVSKSFHSLLSSADIHSVRAELRATKCRLYMCTWSPKHRNWYTIEEINKGELSLVPVKLSSSYSPTLLTSASIVAVGSEIFQIGGAINKKKSKVVVRRSKAVLVFDCLSNTWRRGPKLTVRRKNAKSCFIDGKIYEIGGCNINEDPKNCGEVFDLKTQIWKPLPSPSGIIFDPNYKIVVFGGRLYVITKNDKYAYDPEEGRWVVPGVGFVGLGPISTITEPWCIIDDVMFGVNWGELKWYNPRYEKWSIVYCLHDLFANPGIHQTIQLVNHGGKLVIIWHEGRETKFCAVIRLERRLNLSITEFHGEVERRNVVPWPHKMSFLSVSV